MKPSWKEILVIFVLAILATGLSSFFGSGFDSCNLQDIFSLPPSNSSFDPGQIMCEGGGFPLHYLNGGLWSQQSIIAFVLDSIFYFIIIVALLRVAKFLLSRLRKPS